MAILFVQSPSAQVDKLTGRCSELTTSASTLRGHRQQVRTNTNTDRSRSMNIVVFGVT